MRLPAHAVFASFATGQNSELVSVLGGLGRDPVWIWGNPGSGKSHLLQAVCAARGDSAAYFPLDASIGLPPEALSGLASRQVLCIDDLDAVAGKLDWEQAFFRVFNEATELGTRMIFASRVSPRQIDWALGDWKSRAAACIVYQVRELDEAGRAQALCLRAAQRGLELPPETQDYLLKRMPRDLRTLLDILDALDEESLVAKRRLTVPFIREALERHARIKP
jgi:DnaA family protein